MSVDDSAGEDFILEGEVIWESRITDDIYVLLRAVRNAANQALTTNPTDAIAVAVLDKLNQVGSDGWPDLDSASWRVLAESLLAKHPGDPLAAGLLERISRFEREHLGGQ